jgi:anaerobic magnesium-protoporphyrin IX monomethyl ester cyclase
MEKYWEYADFFSIDRGRSIPVMATRGCPYKCSFCSSPQMWTTRYIVREPEDVVDEIADYVERYGIENINFCDLTAITKRKWTLRFCDELERRDLGVTWQLPVGTRSEALDAEVLRRLAETGCRYVTYAPESGSERMLKVYDKRVNLDSMLESLKEAHRAGLQTRVNIIIGHPEERWSDVWQSLKFLMRAAFAGCDDVAAIMFCPYPGSRNFEDLVESGRFEIDESAYYVGISRTSADHKSYNDKLSTRQLRMIQLGMALTFYGLGLIRRPSRLIKYVRAQVFGEERTFFDQFLRGRLRGFRPST